MRPENSPDGRRSPSFIEAARRAQIIEAAAETVAEVGYANASLAQIARRAATSKSVISYHFESKSELLEQVVTQFFDDAWAYMEPRVGAAESPTAQIRAWVESQLSYFAAHRSGFLAMVQIIDGHRREDGTRPFDGLETEEIDALTQILVDGQRAGEFREFDPRMMAMVISQSMEGVLGRWAYDPANDLTILTPALIDFIEHAIRAERP